MTGHLCGKFKCQQWHIKVQNWAKSVVAVAAKHGIIKGNPDKNFAPLNNSTRAELAAMLMNLLQKADFI